ncbi:hypothetical protein D3C81_1202190 [compost metagenome]
MLPKDQYTRFRDLDLLNNWDSSAQYGPDHVLTKWKEAWLAEQTTSEYEPSLDVVKQRFEDHIVSLIKAHPEIEFTFYYPPYSVIRQQVWYSLNPERFTNQQAMKKYMFEQFSAFDNVKVYDFQSDSSITYDLNLYKDLSHHSAGVNQSIIDAIAADTHRVNKENVDLNNSLLEQQVQSLVINENGPLFSLSITMDGQAVSLKQIPTTSKDQVRVPLKDLAIAAGIEFSYDIPSKTATLTRENVQAILTVGENEVLVNGQPIMLKAPIQIVQNRLVAPLIEVTELLDGEVQVTGNHNNPYFLNYDLSFK